MDIDVDWCLSCGRRTNGPAPYCSRECLVYDDPSALFDIPPIRINSEEDTEEEEEDDYNDIIYHPIQDVPSAAEWIGKGSAGIRAWALTIPFGTAAGAPSPNDPIPAPPPSPPPPSFRPPKLLFPHKRPVPPTLCMSTPTPACAPPSLPILTPRQHIATHSLNNNSSSSNSNSNHRDVDSMGHTSPLSGVTTESSVATPSSAKFVEPPVQYYRRSSKPSIFGALATHVRSWVVPSAPSSPPKPPQPHRGFDSSNFTVLAKTHRSRALETHSMSSSDDSEDDEDAIWWLASTTKDNNVKKVIPRGRLGQALEDGSRARRTACGVRGRKLSRFVS